jgi:hypothetical protein
VNRTTVAGANVDKSPMIQITSPAPNANIKAKATTLTANVADDAGISQVLWFANGRIVCTSTTAPYSCGYQPTGADVGRTGLVATVIDTAQQTATDQRSINVSQFAPAKFTSKVSPSKDRKAPFRFSSTGTLAMPAGVTAAQGCKDGVVSVQIKAGSKTISTRRANITKKCTFSLAVSFADRSRFGKAKKLKFTTRFGGNTVLTRSTASIKYASIR